MRPKPRQRFSPRSLEASSPRAPFSPQRSHLFPEQFKSQSRGRRTCAQQVQGASHFSGAESRSVGFIARSKWDYAPICWAGSPNRIWSGTAHLPSFRRLRAHFSACLTVCFGISIGQPLWALSILYPPSHASATLVQRCRCRSVQKGLPEEGCPSSFRSPS